MTNQPPDALVIQPDLWFGVLCERLGQDATKRIQLINVFNRIFYEEPDRATGIPPHAVLRGLLVIGLSWGVGAFEAELALEDIDGRVLWRAPDTWAFSLNAELSNGAIYAREVVWHFPEMGVYYYVLRFRPGPGEYRVRFDVARRPAPPEETAGQGTA